MPKRSRAESADVDHNYWALVTELAPNFQHGMLVLPHDGGKNCIRPECDTAGSTWPQWQRPLWMKNWKIELHVTRNLFSVYVKQRTPEWNTNVLLAWVVFAKQKTLDLKPLKRERQRYFPSQSRDETFISTVTKYVLGFTWAKMKNFSHATCCCLTFTNSSITGSLSAFTPFCGTDSDIVDATFWSFAKERMGFFLLPRPI